LSFLKEIEVIKAKYLYQANKHEMIFDLYQRSHHNPIELSTLSFLQRILLTTDGTLTKILEAYLLEEIQIAKLSERAILAKDAPLLELEPSDQVIEREILLQGKISRKNFLYARSLLATSRLDEDFRGELNSEIPLGKLMLAHRMETFKEMIALSKESAGESAAFFQISDRDHLLSRTYRLFYRYKPVMIITEKFPQSYFLSTNLDSPIRTLDNF
jgi:chorismate-pyruvate lyase